MKARLLATVILLAGTAGAWFWLNSSFADDSGEQVVASDQARYLAEIQKDTQPKFQSNDDGGIIDITLSGQAVNNATLAHLKGLKFLEIVRLRGTSVTDEGLKVLADVENLRGLHADGSAITSAGMMHLANATSLRELSLAGCSVDDTSLSTIGSFRQLELLNLESTEVTSAAPAALAELKSLQRLYLGGTAVTGESLRDFGELPQLALLSLKGIDFSGGIADFSTQFPVLEMAYFDNSNLGDERFSQAVEGMLSGATAVRGLFLENTQITDAALPALEKLPELKQLSVVRLTGSRVRRETIEPLLVAAPQIRISVGAAVLEE